MNLPLPRFPMISPSSKTTSPREMVILGENALHTVKRCPASFAVHFFSSDLFCIPDDYKIGIIPGNKSAFLQIKYPGRILACDLDQLFQRKKISFDCHQHERKESFNSRN